MKGNERYDSKKSEPNHTQRAVNSSGWIGRKGWKKKELIRKWRDDEWICRLVPTLLNMPAIKTGESHLKIGFLLGAPIRLDQTQTEVSPTWMLTMMEFKLPWHRGNEILAYKKKFIKELLDSISEENYQYLLAFLGVQFLYTQLA